MKMKTYCVDYTKISKVEKLLYRVTRLMATESYYTADVLIHEARELILQYLAEDNMIEDDDVADGWVKMSDIEKLGLLT